MFSVVIPAYNCEKTITKSLDSVLNQTAFDLVEEIIIINDGSTDETEYIIQTYVSENNIQSLVHYYYQYNHGASYTRNRGIRTAKAEWVALLDSDDIWKNNKLERQANIINNNKNISFLGAEYPIKFILKKRTGLVKINPKQLCIRNMPTTPSVVFKKNIAEEVGLFNESMKYCEDINFFQHFFLVDSYYVLAEPLVEIGVGKEFHAQSGLSSHLYEMHKGRNENVRELYRMGMISKFFMYEMLVFNVIKYFRRVLIRKVARIKN